MRKLYILAFMTLDGIMQSDDGLEVDPSGGFTYGGWSTPYFDDFLEQSLAEHQRHMIDGGRGTTYTDASRVSVTDFRLENLQR